MTDTAHTLGPWEVSQPSGIDIVAVFLSLLRLSLGRLERNFNTVF